MSSEFYTEMILDYYRNPRNFGSLENPDVKVRDSNPLCGDVIEMQIKFNGNNIKDIKFNGKGCAISQASASILTEMAKGKNIYDLIKLDKKELLENLGIELSAVRLKCALLSFKVLKLGLFTYLGYKSEAINITEL